MNNLLQLNITKVEQCGTGYAIYSFSCNVEFRPVPFPSFRYTCVYSGLFSSPSNRLPSCPAIALCGGLAGLKGFGWLVRERVAWTGVGWG